MTVPESYSRALEQGALASQREEPFSRISAESADQPSFCAAHTRGGSIPIHKEIAIPIPWPF